MLQGESSGIISVLAAVSHVWTARWQYLAISPSLSFSKNSSFWALNFNL